MPTQSQSTPQPNWQPISALPTIASILDEMLDDALQQQANLQQAKARPYLLDDQTIERLRSAHSQQADDLWLLAEQLRRWQAQTLTAAQRDEVTRLSGQLEQLRLQIEAILSLADELKSGTIESLLGKSDLDIALDVLSGKLQLP
jgi:hypothetical protein